MKWWIKNGTCQWMIFPGSQCTEFNSLLWHHWLHDRNGTGSVKSLPLVPQGSVLDQLAEEKQERTSYQLLKQRWRWFKHILCCSLILKWIQHSFSPPPWTAQDSYLLHAVLTCCEQLHHHCHHQQWYVVSVTDGACLAWPIPFILPMYTAACPPALCLAV